MNRTIRSLEIWSHRGSPGDRYSDAYAARAALAYGARYGIEEQDRLVYVYLPPDWYRRRRDDETARREALKARRELEVALTIQRARLDEHPTGVQPIDLGWALRNACRYTEQQLLSDETPLQLEDLDILEVLQ